MEEAVAGERERVMASLTQQVSSSDETASRPAVGGSNRIAAVNVTPSNNTHTPSQPHVQVRSDTEYNTDTNI